MEKTKIIAIPFCKGGYKDFWRIVKVSSESVGKFKAKYIDCVELTGTEKMMEERLKFERKQLIDKREFMRKEGIRQEAYVLKKAYKEFIRNRKKTVIRTDFDL